MSSETQEPRSIAVARVPAAPSNSRNALSGGGPAERSFDDAPVSVEIFADAGKWYCHVRRGQEKTPPMGPYTRQEAQRIQAIRKLLLAKKGTARLIFEPATEHEFGAQSKGWE